MYNYTSSCWHFIRYLHMCSHHLVVHIQYNTSIHVTQEGCYKLGYNCGFQFHTHYDLEKHKSNHLLATSYTLYLNLSARYSSRLHDISTYLHMCVGHQIGSILSHKYTHMIQLCLCNLDCILHYHSNIHLYLNVQ